MFVNKTECADMHNTCTCHSVGCVWQEEGVGLYSMRYMQKRVYA